MMIAIHGCTSHEKFTRQGWNDGDGIDFPRRERMLKDLLENHKLTGLKYKQVTGLLEEPQVNSRTSPGFNYEIIRKMDGIDTVYAKNLVFYLSKDSVVTAVKIFEKNYKKKIRK